MKIAHFNGHTEIGEIGLLDLRVMNVEIANPVEFNEEMVTNQNCFALFDVVPDLDEGICFCSYVVRIDAESDEFEDGGMATFGFGFTYSVEDLANQLTGEVNEEGIHLITDALFERLASMSHHTARGLLPAYLTHTIFRFFLLPHIPPAEMRGVDLND